MELKIRVSYYLRDKNAKNKTSLLFSITSDDGVREIFSTGISLNPSEWNQEKQKATNKAINDKINYFNRIIEDYDIDHRFINKREFDINDLKMLLFDGDPEKENKVASNDLFCNYISQYYELHKLIKAPNTIKKYKTLENFFRKHYPTLRAKHIDVSFAENLIAFCLAKKEMNNTLNKRLQLIRVVLKWLFDNQKLKPFPLDKFSHSKDEKIEAIALMPEEIDAIANADLSKKPHLESIRDIFVITCLTGVDWADIDKLTKENLHTSSQGNKYFEFNRRKTESKDIISRPPCNKQVEDILKKYKWNVKLKSYQKSLDQVKEVCKIAGLEEDVTLTSRSGNQRIIEIKPKYEWIAWKTGRRSFITNLLLKKKPTEAVAAAVGHVKISTTARYQHAKGEYMVDLLQD